jgi:DNA-binding beta-propeller fold protein YncE
MRKVSGHVLGTLCLAFLLFLSAGAQEQVEKGTPLTLVHRYELPPSIKGHFDHFAVDPKGKRVFGTAVEDKRIVVFDLEKGLMTEAIQGVKEPRAVLYRSDLQRLYVSDGAGALRVFDSASYRLVKTLNLLVDADPIVYDPETKRLFVVNGGEKAKHAYSNITVFDTSASEKIGDIQLEGIEIEGMTVEKKGPRLFANNRDKNQIDIFDRHKLTRIGTWPVTKCRKNTVMALDEESRRVFVACHEGDAVVLDLDSGKELQVLSIGEGADDIDFEPASKRIYVAGGAGNGSVDVYREIDADHYESLGRFISAPGAATARLVPDLGEYIALAPAQKTKRAQVLVFRVSPSQ